MSSLQRGGDRWHCRRLLFCLGTTFVVFRRVASDSASLPISAAQVASAVCPSLLLVAVVRTIDDGEEDDGDMEEDDGRRG